MVFGKRGLKRGVVLSIRFAKQGKFVKLVRSVLFVMFLGLVVAGFGEQDGGWPGPELDQGGTYGFLSRCESWDSPV